jgi:thiol-disulfide isomerase/thioredoxin
MIVARRVLVLLALALGLAAAAPAWGVEDRLFDELGIHRLNQRVLAPEVSLTDLNGKAATLKDFRGKLVILNFWATWCIPCLFEMPEFEQLYQAYKDKGFVVVAVSIDQSDVLPVRQYVVDRKMTYPVFHDPEGKVIRTFAPRAFPATYLIGPDGAVIGFVYGPRRWAGPEARALIGELLRLRPEKKAMLPQGGPEASRGPRP